MDKTYSVSIANAITKFLEEDGWHYQFDEEDGTYRMTLGLDCDLATVLIYIHVYDDSFTVNMISPITVKNDPDKRREMAEFICRANYGVKCGGFQCDIQDDGDILYKVYTPCHDIVPSQEMVKHSIYFPAMMFNKYAEGILAILFANVTAKEAVSACEDSPSKAEEVLDALGTAVENGDQEVGDILARLAARLGITDDDDNGEEVTGANTLDK